MFRKKEKSHLNWASDDLISKNGVKSNILQNYLINLNTNLKVGKKQAK